MESIMIYFGLYICVLILTFIAEILFKKNKIVSLFFIVLSILSMSIFSGIRDYAVGIDIKVYGLNIFSRCFRYNNLSNYMNNISSEQLYYLLNYVIHMFSNNYHVFLFVLQLISSILIYIMAFKNIEKYSPTFFIFCYFMLFYNTTFNILRQITAIIIILYSYSFLEKNEYIKFIIGVIVAYLFHSSSIVCLMFLIIKIICKTKKAYLYGLIMGIGMIGCFYFADIIFPNLPFFSDKYFSYLTSEANIRYKYLIVKTVILAFILFFKQYIKNNEEMDFLIIVSFFDVIFYLSSAFFKAGYRLSYFFGPYLFYLIPSMSKLLKGKRIKYIYVYGIILLLIFHWLTRYYFIGYDGVIPYSGSFSNLFI